MRQGCRGARLHPEKRLSGDSTKPSYFARTSDFPIGMREYVAQAVEKLAAIGPLAWAPSTTPPLLQLGRVRGSDNDETAFDDGQEEDDEGVVT